MKRNKRYDAIGACILLAAGFTATALAEDIWIKAETVDIRAGKGAVYPVVATVQKGTQLTVIDHEGHWLHVQVGTQDGYVYDTAVSSDKVGGGGNMLADLGAGANASNMSSGAAGKGLAPEADTWAAGKNMDPGPMNKLIAFRKKFDPKLWEKFTADGKVGPDAPGAQ
jgi:hypothetical protein